MANIKKHIMSALLFLIMAFISTYSITANAIDLPRFLNNTDVSQFFPGADRVDQPADSPPVSNVYAGDEHIGYIYLTSDIVNTAGYSSRPIRILVAMGLDGELKNLKLVEHDEPIVLIGIAISRIEAFIDAYVGLNFVKNPPKGRMEPPVEIISGATVTLMVIGDSLIRSSLIVARDLGGIGNKAGDPSAATQTVQAKATIDESVDEVFTWEQLLENGSVQALHLTVDDVNEAFKAASNPEAVNHPEEGEPDDTFIDMYIAQVSVPSIGRSVLGDVLYNQLKDRLKPEQQAIVIAGNGPYSFKGSGYVRGGVFDRVEVLQGPVGFRFRDLYHQRIGDIMAQGAPRFREIALFTVPEDQAFDATDPWKVELLVQRVISVEEKAFMTFDVDYAIPDQFLIKPEPTQSSTAIADTSVNDSAYLDDGLDRDALWIQMWEAKTVQIVVLLIALFILTCVFFFQNWFTSHAVFYERFRIAYLAFTLFWIGGYCVAQLSVVNVLTFTHSLRTGFQWEYFLMDPLVFILWCATAVSSLFWNRGAFCGWLCPFGALQELLNKVAKFFGVKQVNVPFGLHERLTTFKYVIFLALFAFSLYDLGFAERMAEVEPFKTSIILKFMRHWPYVLFAASLLFAGLFIERFYCRYMCPLGAALAIPAKLRLFDWLKRYNECGNPCQRCAVECPVDAIHPEGHINPNECIQCLNCQVLYHHKTKCPHLIKKYAKRKPKPAPKHDVQMQAQSLQRTTAKPGATVVPRSS